MILKCLKCDGILVNVNSVDDEFVTVTVWIDSNAWIAEKLLPTAAPNPKLLADWVVNSGIYSPYANLVCDPNTVKVADPVLIIVNTYESIEDAFPAAGAVPPCHFGVTAEPSIWNVDW